jgi:hypothetical protein
VTVDGCWPNLTSPEPIIATSIVAVDEEIVPIFMPEIGSVHYVNEHFCAVIIDQGIARCRGKGWGFEFEATLGTVRGDRRNE